MRRSRLKPVLKLSPKGLPDEIVERQLGHFEKVHPDYAAGVRKALTDLA